MDTEIINTIRELNGFSIRELARRAGNVQPRNLASYFSGQAGKVSKEKLAGVYVILNITDESLLPGIHRWMIPSATTSDVEKAEYLVRELCPGGCKVYPIRSENLVQAIVSASLGNFLPWIAWVLVPAASPQIRIVLSIKPSAKHLNFIGSFRSLSPKSFGGILPDGSSPEEIPSSAWISIRPEIFSRVKSDPELTVPDLDAILGISGNPDWTWERLNAVLQGKGITPEEAARKCGIL